MPTKLPAPSEHELRACLGPAYPLWREVHAAVAAFGTPLEPLWQASKAEFGRMCLLQHRKRTLLYVTPDQGKLWIAIVLGDRACERALASALPDPIKRLLSEAKPYAEGRGIRFAIASPSDLPTVTQLLECKTAPR